MNRRFRRKRDHRLRGARSRPGFALFMALGALVIIGVLVAGSSFITMQESRLGQNGLVQAKAFAMAEYGLNKIQADWDKTPNLELTNGLSYEESYELDGQGTCKVRYTRLNNETFWIVSEGRATVGNSISASRVAVKRIGAILRLRIPTIKAEGAITTNGTINVQGSPSITGINTPPPGWSGCSSAANKPGLVLPPATTPTIQVKNPPLVSGDPQYVNSAVASNLDTYVKYGDETWNTLRSGANHSITTPPVGGPAPTYIVNTTTCNKSDPTNYGEPWRSGSGHKPNCENYFPIIFATCDPPPPPTGNNLACVVHFQGGRGQGILLVDGDIKMNGNFEWTGLIIVTGRIAKANGTATIHGGIMAANADIGGEVEGSEALGNLTVKYSACGVERAMRGSAQVVQAKERAWTELY